MAKKIKFKPKYYFGKIENGRYFLGDPMMLLDVTQQQERLPEDIRLAFLAYGHFDKNGKDEPFRPHKEADEGSGIGGHFQEDT